MSAIDIFDKAVRELYRGDGGSLNAYDEGWNDGVEAAMKALRAEGRELKRLRSGILAMQKIPYGHQPDWDFIYREAIRIKKSRKAK